MPDGIGAKVEYDEIFPLAARPVNLVIFMRKTKGVNHEKVCMQNLRLGI